MFAEEGIHGFYKGTVLSCIGASEGAIHFMIYEVSKKNKIVLLFYFIIQNITTITNKVVKSTTITSKNKFNNLNNLTGLYFFKFVNTLINECFSFLFFFKKEFFTKFFSNGINSSFNCKLFIYLNNINKIFKIFKNLNIDYNKHSASNA